MIVIGREHANLRPAARPAVRIDHHPGMVIHCTGGQRPGSLDVAKQRWRRCQSNHMAAPDWRDVVDPETGETHRKNFGGNGWSDIGYHFGVAPDGSILEGRGWNARGAHAGKGWNRHLGVVVLGKGVELLPDEELAIEAIYAAHLSRGGGAAVLPHNAISRKRCPGPAVTAWVRHRWPSSV